MSKIGFDKVRKILTLFMLCLLGVLGLVFIILYVNSFSDGFFKEYSTIINALSTILISFLVIFAIVFFRHNKEFIYKLCFCVISIISLISVTLYLLKISGFFDKIDSVESFRNYVSSFGNWTSIIFVVFQFLQVVLLPIPSFITVGAGVLLFGPLIGSILSCIGIIAGSLVAYFIGKIFGYNLVKWLVGRDTLDKWLIKIKGKDKIILTFMFLFPFFPDDVLCFVAGITTVNPIYFVVMIFIVRIVCIFTSSYSMNNNLIPYDTWWGILLWILFFLATIVATIIVYKKGEKIECWFSKKRRNYKGKPH